MVFLYWSAAGISRKSQRINHPYQTNQRNSDQVGADANIERDRRYAKILRHIRQGGSDDRTIEKFHKESASHQ